MAQTLLFRMPRTIIFWIYQLVLVDGIVIINYSQYRVTKIELL